MPTFCRHNRFIERCPICSRTLPGAAPAAGAARRSRAQAGTAVPGSPATGRRVRGGGVRVHREGRAEDDGYRSALVPGVRAGEDARRLAEELAFASGRLSALAAAPPGLYGEVAAFAHDDRERASWTCVLIAYLSPTTDEDPFAGIRAALAQAPTLSADGPLPELDGIALGARTCHDAARGAATLAAYRQWAQRFGGAEGTQAAAFTGDDTWTPERRFARLFERLALPGLGRVGRYELLVTLGRLGVYELQADSLHLAGAGGVSGSDTTTLAAKRVFGIGDPMLLDRRAAALAEALAVPIEALDLALSNWAAPSRAGVGVPVENADERALERAEAALGL